MQGISVLRAMPKIQQALMKVNDTREDEKENLKLASAKEAAEFANKECESGFPLMHAHTVVGCWGAFEAAIEDMLVGVLMNEPEVLRREAFARLRIPLAEFELLDKEQRMRLLIGDLGRNSTFGRKQGVDGFEGMLAAVSLDGVIDDDIKKTIWEMHHVRNVIVHRVSLADRRLVKNCSWMGLRIGDKVVVTHESLGSYGEALAKYVLIIVERACLRYGVDLKKRLAEKEAPKAS
jgi:hypothetical protein